MNERGKSAPKTSALAPLGERVDRRGVFISRDETGEGVSRLVICDRRWLLEELGSPLGIPRLALNGRWLRIPFLLVHAGSFILGFACGNLSFDL